jgi:hypothetical protein
LALRCIPSARVVVHYARKLHRLINQKNHHCVLQLTPQQERLHCGFGVTNPLHGVDRETTLTI